METGSKVEWVQGRGKSVGTVEAVEGDIAVVVSEKTGSRTRRKVALLTLLSAPPKVAKKKKQKACEEQE